MKVLQLTLLLAIVLAAQATRRENNEDALSIKKDADIDMDKKNADIDMEKKDADKKALDLEKKETIKHDDVNLDKKEMDLQKKDNIDENIAEKPMQGTVLKRTIEEITKKTIEEPVIRAELTKEEIEAMEANKKLFLEAVEKKDDETIKKLYSELLTKKKVDGTEDFVNKEIAAKHAELKTKFNAAVEKKDYEEVKRIYNKSFDRKKAFGTIKRADDKIKRSGAIPPKKITIEKIVKKTIEEVPATNEEVPATNEEVKKPSAKALRFLNRKALADELKINKRAF